jgi:hypothetical protein
VQEVDRVHRRPLGGLGDLPPARLAVAPEARTCSKRSAPTAIPTSYFSAFSPYVPAMPQQRAFISVTCRPGMSASSSSAGLPIQWPCCWHGAW